MSENRAIIINFSLSICLTSNSWFFHIYETVNMSLVLLANEPLLNLFEYLNFVHFLVLIRVSTQYSLFIFELIYLTFNRCSNTILIWPVDNIFRWLSIEWWRDTLSNQFVSNRWLYSSTIYSFAITFISFYLFERILN